MAILRQVVSNLMIRQGKWSARGLWKGGHFVSLLHLHLLGDGSSRESLGVSKYAQNII